MTTDVATIWYVHMDDKLYCLEDMGVDAEPIIKQEGKKKVYKLYGIMYWFKSIETLLKWYYDKLIALCAS